MSLRQNHCRLSEEALETYYGFFFLKTLYARLDQFVTTLHSTAIVGPSPVLVRKCFPGLLNHMNAQQALGSCSVSTKR